MANGLLVNYNADIPEGFREAVASTGLPAVWINSQQPSASVFPDDRAGAAEAVRQLVALGHRLIGFLDYNKGEEDDFRHYSFAERRAGYHEAVAAADLLSRRGGVHAGDRLAFTRAWMQADDRPTTVVCYNDEMVATLHVTAATLGLVLPRDLLILAFSPRNVVSVDLGIDHLLIDTHAIGVAAASMLNAMIAGSAQQPSRPIAMPYIASGSTALCQQDSSVTSTVG